MCLREKRHEVMVVQDLSRVCSLGLGTHQNLNPNCGVVQEPLQRWQWAVVKGVRQIALDFWRLQDNERDHSRPISLQGESRQEEAAVVEKVEWKSSTGNSPPWQATWGYNSLGVHVECVLA